MSAKAAAKVTQFPAPDQADSLRLPEWAKNGDTQWYATPESYPTLLRRGLTTTQSLVLHCLLIAESRQAAKRGKTVESLDELMWIDVRQQDIAQFAGKDEKYIQSVIASLDKAGIIARRKVGAPGGRTKTVYQIKARDWRKAKPEPPEIEKQPAEDSTEEATAEDNVTDIQQGKKQRVKLSPSHNRAQITIFGKRAELVLDSPDYQVELNVNDSNEVKIKVAPADESEKTDVANKGTSESRHQNLSGVCPPERVAELAEMLTEELPETCLPVRKTLVTEIATELGDAPVEALRKRIRLRRQKINSPALVVKLARDVRGEEYAAKPRPAPSEEYACFYCKRTDGKHERDCEWYDPDED